MPEKEIFAPFVYPDPDAVGTTDDKNPSTPTVREIGRAHV
jgi:hypothetical protein